MNYEKNSSHFPIEVIKNMEMMGLCQKCGRPSLLHTCHLCGTNVCDLCFDNTHNICKQCSIGTKIQ